MKPEFIDNREARTLAQALRDLCDDPSCAHAPLDIATAYFNLGAFQQLADVLESRPGVRLLLGTEPLSPLDGAGSNDGGSRPLGAGVRQGLEGLERQLATDRDALPFSIRTARDVCRLAAFLRRETVSVRRFADKFLHGKAYLFRGQGVIAGSANFTQAGLLSNLELALGHYQPSVIAEAERWFDDLYEDAEDYRERLIEILTARETQTWTPHDVFLRALLELYEDELDLLRDDESFAPGQPGGVSLADFQRHGVQRALRALDRIDGVIVGDGVGLGKSFIGSALLKHFVNEEGQRALVLVPAALRDSFWARHMIEEGIAAEVLSYQELASERQLGGEVARLKLPKDAYRFVLVDEAHAFRNPDTEQYRALSRLMGGSRKKLSLLTATPVNNSVFDLYHQIMLFARHNARFASVGIPNLTEYFKRAIEAAGHGESSTAMFGLMDAISVRRTRRFIQEHYPNARVAGKPISFPEPELQTVRYDLDGAYPGLFAQVEHEMDALTLARYQPDNYRIDGDADLRAQALAGLLRTGLLKRFESSVHAFRLTTQTMIRAHEKFLTALDEREMVLTPGAQLGAADEAVDPAAVVEGGKAVGRPAAEYRRDELRRDVEADLERLRGLAAAVAGATFDNDPKLDELARLLKGGLGEEKVIVFSYYADTIDWIESALTADADGKRFGARRFVSVTGTSTDTVAQRLEKVREFSPETMADEAGAGSLAPEDEKGVLLATDVLAEGQNLQQARYIVNYDMPWNPMRLVQRNGRIDRLGSTFETIKLVNLFPEGELDGILKLYETLLRKIGHANVSVGMESPVFEDVAAVDRSFGATAAADPLDRRGGDARARRGGGAARRLLGRGVPHGAAPGAGPRPARRAASDAARCRIGLSRSAHARWRSGSGVCDPAAVVGRRTPRIHRSAGLALRRPRWHRVRRRGLVGQHGCGRRGRDRVRRARDPAACPLRLRHPARARGWFRGDVLRPVGARPDGDHRELQPTSRPGLRCSEDPSEPHVGPVPSRRTDRRPRPVGGSHGHDPRRRPCPGRRPRPDRPADAEPSAPAATRRIDLSRGGCSGDPEGGGGAGTAAGRGGG